MMLEDVMTTELLDDLRRDGIVVVPRRFGDRELAEFIAYMDDKPVWPAHVVCKSKVPYFPAGSKTMLQARTDGEWSAFAPTMDAVVGAPYWLEYAISVLPFAKQYFGEPPLLYSLLCFWTQPGRMPYVETHDWHHDHDDRKQLGLFMFGTDVIDDAEGAHFYECGSADRSEHPVPLTGAIVAIKGPAGTIWLEQPCGLHRGQRPNKSRLYVWARYGVTDPPPQYTMDGLHPVPKELIGARYPADQEIQKAIRLIVA